MKGAEISERWPALFRCLRCGRGRAWQCGAGSERAEKGLRDPLSLPPRCAEHGEKKKKAAEAQLSKVKAAASATRGSLVRLFAQAVHVDGSTPARCDSVCRTCVAQGPRR